ncbi:hypothetical protein ACJA23_00875 [Mycoplasma corogypsi]|uniref:hypothetical protein n=1 Tax=Mycoplasma corogypsi TaxID=2106 RepID=UPI00387303AC
MIKTKTKKLLLWASSSLTAAAVLPLAISCKTEEENTKSPSTLNEGKTTAEGDTKESADDLATKNLKAVLTSETLWNNSVKLLAEKLVNVSKNNTDELDMYANNFAAYSGDIKRIASVLSAPGKIEELRSIFLSMVNENSSLIDKFTKEVGPEITKAITDLLNLLPSYTKIVLASNNIKFNDPEWLRENIKLNAYDTANAETKTKVDSTVKLLITSLEKFQAELSSIPGLPLPLANVEALKDSEQQNAIKNGLVSISNVIMTHDPNVSLIDFAHNLFEIISNLPSNALLKILGAVKPITVDDTFGGSAEKRAKFLEKISNFLGSNTAQA